MAVMDYQQLLEDVITPEITETVFKKNYDEMESLFTRDPLNPGGSKIIDPQRTSMDSTARNYNRDDVDPEGGSFVTVNVEWNKIYQEVAFEVHGIDESESTNDGITTVRSLITDAAMVAAMDLGELMWNNLYTRIKADIDDTNAYGDNSVSRTTYPTLASYVEDTDTPITIDILRTTSNTTRLNKNTGGKSRYLWVMESQVYDKFEPLAAALHTWNITGQAGKPVDAGYQVIGNFEGTNVVAPQGMTTGDTFFVRPEDVLIRNHRAMTIKQVPSGRDSAKFIMRAGVTSRVKNPGFQAKLENKD
jgi:hypothetical protein